MERFSNFLFSPIQFKKEENLINIEPLVDSVRKLVKKWVPAFLAIFAGFIAIIGDIVGSARFFKILFDIASRYVPGASFLFGWVLTVLYFFAALGGVTIILGGILILADHPALGRFLIGIGIGVGLIGLIISLIIAAIGGTLITEAIGLLITLISVRGIAIIISIIARRKSKQIGTEG